LESCPYALLEAWANHGEIHVDRALMCLGMHEQLGHVLCMCVLEHYLLVGDDNNKEECVHHLMKRYVERIKEHDECLPATVLKTVKLYDQARLVDLSQQSLNAKWCLWHTSSIITGRRSAWLDTLPPFGLSSHNRLYSHTPMYYAHFYVAKLQALLAYMRQHEFSVIGASDMLESEFPSGTWEDGVWLLCLPLMGQLERAVKGTCSNSIEADELTVRYCEDWCQSVQDWEVALKAVQDTPHERSVLLTVAKSVSPGQLIAMLPENKALSVLLPNIQTCINTSTATNLLHRLQCDNK